MFCWSPKEMHFHVDQGLIFWWKMYWWNVDVLTSCLTNINFCETRSLFLVDVEQKLKFVRWSVDKVLLKCWFLLIFCWFFVGIPFSPGAPLSPIPFYCEKSSITEILFEEPTAQLKPQIIISNLKVIFFRSL